MAFGKRWVLAIVVMSACSSSSLTTPPPPSTTTSVTTETFAGNHDLDVLFVIDDSPEMLAMQEKLQGQMATFFSLLESSPTGLPNLHVGVVSTDMGAPGDAAGTDGCTASGDGGQLLAAPQATCATTLAPGSTFVSDVGDVANFTDQIGNVLQCMIGLGQAGCGFEQPLAALDRALGADGLGPPPAQNAGFLRADADLAIIILTNEDDCSAPAGTTLFSLNGAPESLQNPLGPLANYRCNQWGHLCKDPTAADPNQYAMPPLNPPADAQTVGNVPRLDLVDCKDNDQGTGLLTPVSKFVNDIKALKTDPDNHIYVSAISGSAVPYTVQWAPGFNQVGPATELWPEVMHVCGPAGASGVNPASTMLTTDGSFADPAVRVAEFANAFRNSSLTSICSPDYSPAFSVLSSSTVGTIPPCVTGQIQTDAAGQPICTVIDEVAIGQTTTTFPVPACDDSGEPAPCYILAPAPLCDGIAVEVNETHVNLNADRLQRTIACSICVPGSTAPGC